jgi:hypothetical protein
MDNLLFVAFEFPPLGGAGVQRSLKFAKYLPENNINPVIVTIQKEGYSSLMADHPIDQSLCNDLSPQLIIERVSCKLMPVNESKLANWYRIFSSVVESYNHLWLDDLKKRIPDLITKYKPKAIYISVPPFSMAPLWQRVLKGYDIPVILDFRDAWTQWCVSPNQSYFHYRAKLKMERSALTWSTAVICSTEQIKKDMLRVHPEISPEKFHIINNGYDENVSIPDVLETSDSGRVVFGYVGSFYYTPESRSRIFTSWWKKKPHQILQYVPRKEDWLYRSPYFFFRTIQQLLIKQPALRSRIEIRFAGKTPKWLKEQIQSFGLTDICFHVGYLKHSEVIKFQHDCDFLLLTSAKVLGGRDYSIAGKTFEYFTICKPILAFVCEGEQKDILLKSGMSVVCDPDDQEGNLKILENIFSGKTTLHPNNSFIQGFHRKELTKKLVEIITDCKPNSK